MFKASHVFDVKFNSSHDDFCFFDARVKASMTRNKIYRTKLRQNKAGEVMSAQCTCKAGANGYCKHVGALLYTILDFSESGLKQIPPNTSCTEKPQQWHKPAQRISNVPVLFKDILMIKHDYDGDKRQKTEKRIQRKNAKEAYSSCPSFAQRVTRDQIIDLCQELKKLPKESNAVIIKLLQGNDCKPVTVKKIEDNFAKHAVHVDHDYVPGRHKRYATQMEEEASECELNQFFKQDFICCSEGNECEPLDINFSSDIVISHSVIISNLPEPAMETGMAVETGIAVIYEENLEVANVQSNDDFTIPNPSQSYPDDLDLTEENFILVCKECMKSIKITEDGINTVEEKTRGQSSNSEWFKYRNGRLTASKFGEISHRRITTPPDRLVRDLFQYKARPNVPYQCKVGLEMEPVIISKYIEHQNIHGHEGITVKEKGLIIDKENPVLAASVDGEVTDPSNKYHPVGNIEAKYKLFPSKLKEQVDTKQVQLLKTLAKHTKNFCLEITESGLKLKEKHSYYIQVQGGMAITRQPWCDLVVYTTFLNHEDIHIERIYFDPTFWEGLKKKLLDFYLYAMVPELLTSRVKRGMPMYPKIFPYK